LPKLTTFYHRPSGKELAAMPDAVIIRSEKIAGEVIGFLHKQKLIHLEKIPREFPACLGSQRHRKRVYNEGREHWRASCKIVVLRSTAVGPHQIAGGFDRFVSD